MDDLKQLLDQAHAAGQQAANACVPTPMTIAGFPPVADGVCGFAWITIRPGNSKLALAAKKHYGARPAYGGGLQIWVGDYNQSMEKKEAYARAFAKVLTDAGHDRVYPGSRMD